MKNPKQVYYTRRLISNLKDDLRNAENFDCIEEMQGLLQLLLDSLPASSWFDGELLDAIDTPYRPLKCPSKKEVEDLKIGELAPRLAEGIIWHIDKCSLCLPI